MKIPHAISSLPLLSKPAKERTKKNASIVYGFVEGNSRDDRKD
jgi:hypothetical protein